MSADEETYSPAMPVTRKLDPGFYEIKATMQGIFFVKIATGKEGLIKFPETTSDAVVKEIETFWEAEKNFREHKLAFKRGIILYGPPGSGKTCTIKLVIENVIKRNGVVIKFSSPGVFEDGMTILRKIQPHTPVIALMEDLDAILYRCNESDVINLLDGVTQVDKTVFLATTNYPEKLGSRIMNRPSRFDKKFFIGMPNEESRKIYFDYIGKGKLSQAEIGRWVKDTDGLSISHLKELFVAVKILGDEYDNAINTLKDMRIKVDSTTFDPFAQIENKKMGTGEFGG
jgi:ATP-dependent 26S proteasome regulatory subunit